jgi:manganese-dependent ADP-ribose/CDP-alcohol diphosphatase
MTPKSNQALYPMNVIEDHDRQVDEYDNAANDEDNNHILTMGVIADIQHAPIPNGFSYSGTPRYYRHSLSTAKHAALHFEKEQVSLVINLGDIIDGKCQEVHIHCKDEKDFLPPDNDPGHDAIDSVLDALSAYSGDILHTYGNHELYNFSREDIGNKLNIPFVKEECGELVGYYYKTSICNKVRFVVIDSYDVAIMKRNDGIKRQKAVSILQQNNPNYPEKENSPEGLKGVNKRFVAFNGAVDTVQLSWLRATLEEAKLAKQMVFIISHQPIIPESSSGVCLIWNYDEILDILREYKSIVAAAFAGHAHKGSYRRDPESGIHFRIFEAALESPDPIKTYGFVDIFTDKVVVRGEGDLHSAEYILDHLRIE